MKTILEAIILILTAILGMFSAQAFAAENISPAATLEIESRKLSLAVIYGQLDDYSSSLNSLQVKFEKLAKAAERSPELKKELNNRKSALEEIVDLMALRDQMILAGNKNPSPEDLLKTRFEMNSIKIFEASQKK